MHLKKQIKDLQYGTGAEDVRKIAEDEVKKIAGKIDDIIDSKFEERVKEVSKYLDGVIKEHVKHEIRKYFDGMEEFR